MCEVVCASCWISATMWRSRQELNLASRAGAEAITCCGWQETHERGVLGDRVHCSRGESNSSHTTDPVAFVECSPSNAPELRSKSFVLTVRPWGTNSRWTMPRLSKNTMSMVFVELRLILAFFGRGDDEFFHCDDFVSGSYPWLVVPPFTYVITKMPIKQLPMLTQRCLLAHCLIKIVGRYSCQRNPVLPSVVALQR
jgi:hypothetical protein